MKTPTTIYHLGLFIYHVILFWPLLDHPLSYYVIVWLTLPTPHMYDAINEYVISFSEYFKLVEEKLNNLEW